MKKLFMLSLLVLVSGCGFEVSDDKGYNRIIEPTAYLDSNNITVVEGCEYFVVDAYASKTYVHKGNCKNPIHYHK